MKKKKEMIKWAILFIAALLISFFALNNMLLNLKAADYEAKIGTTYYETLEEAFENAKSGNTITVLKDCSVSKTLEVNAYGITLKSGDSENPAVIRRGTPFTGKEYQDVPDILLWVGMNNFTTKDIILDGGAVFDENFANSGESWNSPLVYTNMRYTMGKGTVLRNNYNGYTPANGKKGTAGAVHVGGYGELVIDGALIENCHTNGDGGGIFIGSPQGTARGTSGTVRNCSAMSGGAVSVSNVMEVSGITFSGNRAEKDGGAVYTEARITLTDCILEGNTAGAGGGGLALSGALWSATADGCTFRGNRAVNGSAIKEIEQSGLKNPVSLTVRDCTFSGNEGTGSPEGSGIIDYEHKGGLLLDGSIVMENSSAGGGGIMLSDKNAGAVVLGENFVSDSVIALGSLILEPEVLLVNAAENSIETDAGQFPWYGEAHRTIKKDDGNIYLAPAPITYTITYVANGGECPENEAEAEKDSFITLPECVREGYGFLGWYEDGELTTPAGKAGEKYFPMGDITLYAGWKDLNEPGPSDYEARIGDVYYEKIEGAFEALKAGDTVTVLKDCDSSKTLEVKADNVTLESEDAGNPAVISREECFSGKYYEDNAGNVLLGINGGSITTKNIILDGGAAVDDSLVNSGQFWDSPLVYAGGSYTMGEGTVLRNNYNGDEPADGDYRTGGAVHVTGSGAFVMNGGLIENCHTSGEGGGILTMEGASVKMTSGTVRNCSATYGGAVELLTDAEIAGVTFTGNRAVSDGGAVYGYSTLMLSDCVFDGNRADFEGGGIALSGDYKVVVEGCSFRNNSAVCGSAVQMIGFDGKEQLVVKDCSFTGNLVTEPTRYGSVINYGHEGGIMLNGSITMRENNLKAGRDCGIMRFDEKAGPVLLGKDFFSESVFTLGSLLLEPEVLVVDAETNKIETDAEQFPWYKTDYRTVKKDDGNIYLSEAPVIYTITFDPNGGECEETEMKTEQGRVTLPECTKEGYEFAGWYEDAELTIPAGKTGESYEPSADKTLYAGWIKKADESGGDKEDVSGNDKEDISGNDKEPEEQEYTIIFNPNGGECKEKEKKTEQGKVTLPECIREGYEFTGWYEDEELTIPAGKAGESYEPSADKTLYAGWEKKADESGGDKGDISGNDKEDISGNDKEPEYCITFNPNGGECEETEMKTEQGKITLPECTKEGYEFTGWYEDEELTIPAGKAGGSYESSADKTLYAGWKKKADESGGDKEDVSGNDKEDVSGNDKEPGKEDTSGNDKEPGKEDISGNDKEAEEKKYTVTFDANGGECEKSSIMAKKGDVIILPLCRKEGFDFTGWHTKKDGGILLGIAGSRMEAVGNMTVYAHYEKKADSGSGKTENCKVTFQTGGGTLKVKELTVVKNGLLTLPLPEYAGYEFKGWYLDREFKQYAGGYKDTYRVTDDIVFYAKWEKAGSNENVGKGSGSSVADNDNTDSKGGSNDNTGEDSGGIWLNMGDTGKETEPVIQTGRVSPVYGFAVLGICGMLLMVLSVQREKRGQEGKLV